jgi:anti-sigma factor RsiW
MSDHLSEEDLILHYYNEASAEAHLDACPDCRQRLATLQLSLNALDSYTPPDLPANYPAQVWARLAPQIGVRNEAKFSWRPFGLALPALASLALAFYLGRVSNEPKPLPSPAPQIFRAATADHLDLSLRVLLETVNATPNAKQGVQLPRERAEELLSTNRLLRRSAQQSGQGQVAELLDELERILLAIARSPETLSSAEYSALEDRIAEQGLLFRVRVLENQVQTSSKGTTD